MLAALTHYLSPWQLLVIVPLVLLWLIGGGWMIGVSIRRSTQARRFHPGQGVVATLLATLAGGFGLGVVMLMFITLNKATSGPPTGLPQPLFPPLYLVGLAVGVIVALPVMFVVFYSMFKATASQVFKAMLTPTLGILVIAGIAGGVLFDPVVTGGRDKQNLEFCVTRLSGIREMLQHHAANRELPPATIRALMAPVVDKPDEYAQCPGNREEPEGYIYLPFSATSTQTVENRLVLADRKDNHLGIVNVIVLTAVNRGGRLDQTLQLQSMSKDSFDKLLDEPVNEMFKRAYNAPKPAAAPASSQ